MNILIPNATSPKNLGDLAMLTSLVRLLRKTKPGASILVHSIDPLLLRKQIKEKTTHSLLSWILFEDASMFTRLRRMGLCFLQFLFPSHAFSPTLTKILRDYRQADAIVFVGNGSIRTQRGIKQSLYLLCLLTTYVAAQQTGKPIILAPMGFGPFAYTWQEKLAAAILKKIQHIYVREHISLKRGKRAGLLHITFASDHAFLLPIQKRKLSKSFVVGFTVRNWFSKEKQAVFETAYADGIAQFARQHRCTVQPIIQVDAPEHNERDAQASESVITQLIARGVTVRKSIHLTSLSQAERAYGSLGLLVGMRMHSNIMAAVVGTPFVAVGYEHKTRGIVGTLKLTKYAIEADSLTGTALAAKMQALYRHKTQIHTKLIKITSIIRAREQVRWVQTLRLL